MSIRVVPRPRLVELLATRWHQRVVAIVAGPGFGKSVLLAHAMSENMLAPRGVDVLIRCNEADSTPSHFLARIADALGEETTEVPSPLTVEWLFAELTRRWPLGVCLLVDDAHLVSRGPVGLSS